MEATNSVSTVTQFIQALPKAELHLHLEGAIHPQTVLSLARRHNQTLPATSLEELQRWFVFTDFQHFRQICRVMKDLLQTPEDFALIAYECGHDMAAQNIRYREVSVTAYAHTHYLNKDLTIDDILQGLEAGRQQARQEFGVEIRWIFDIPRNRSFPEGRYDPRPAEQTLEHVLAGKAFGVIGLGLAGDEVNAPPAPFAPVFQAAKAAGLLSLPHAGETQGPASIWGAIDDLQADRIGHGVRAIEDPALVAELHRRNIPLEVNLTSNICLHVYDHPAQHPLPQLDRQGLKLTLNSDDPPLFNTNLCQEYQLLVDHFGYTRADLIRLARNALEVCGAEPPLKARLLQEFDAWVELN
jgi:aminodeoxyfutalosine deaminase